MENFDLKKYLAEGKLHEAMPPQDVWEIAQMIANEFTKEDAEGDRLSTYMIYKVGNIDGMSFELDTEATEQTPERDAKYGTGQGWGGMFRIKPTEDGYEIRNSEKGGLVATIDNMGNFRMLSAAESRAEMGMVDGEKTDYMERRRETDDYMQEGGDAQLMPSDPIVGFSQVASEFKDKLENNPQIDKIADMIIAKMSTEDKEAFVQKFKGKDEKSIFKMAMAMLKGLDEAVVDRDSAAGKFVALLGNLAGINLMALGGAVLGTFIGKVLLGIAVPVIPALISLVVSLIIRNVAGKLLGEDPNYTGLAGLEEGKETPKSNKMKKSELKEMIKAAMLNEASEFDTNKPARIEAFLKLLDDLVDEYHAELHLNDDLFSAIEDVKSAAKAEIGGPVGDIPGFEGTMDALDSLSIREEKKEDKEEEEVEVEDEEIDVDIDQEEVDMDMDMDMEDGGEVGLTGDKKVVDDSLEAALEAARSLGDEKLVDQIGNTITFFTRSQIVKETINKEKMLQEVKRMQRIAGIIK